MQKINCVIVTFNRLILLKECINAVQNQSYPILKIIVINNASTDNTRDYLTSLSPELFEIVNLEKNTGGAGGFNAGLKKSVEYNADWTWVMDDDTIPNRDALEKLVNKIDTVENTGFLCSKVLYTDGTVHKMNNSRPPLYIHDIAYSQYTDNNILLFNKTSFVSCLINNRAIKKVGFPISELFIWSDDIEYTERITNAGYFGIFVPESNVVHKTANNYSTSLVDSDSGVFWKFYYGQRNEIYFLRKKSKTLKFCFKFLKEVSFRARQCLKNKNGSLKLLIIVIRGCFSGLFFNPGIEYYHSGRGDND
ncbi:glycosyl transferase [Spirochaetia bacterium]|nr:glycosyl transferase [Spirochaetia bacterium]